MALCCLMLSSCETLREIQQSEAVKNIGSFQLNPVHPDTYWYDGKSYEYNEYKIEITSEPVQARIDWSGRVIGTTPLVYAFTGTLDRDEYLRLRAIPIDSSMAAQEATLRIRTELPRKIHFDLRKQ